MTNLVRMQVELFFGPHRSEVNFASPGYVLNPQYDNWKYITLVLFVFPFILFLHLYYVLVCKSYEYCLWPWPYFSLSLDLHMRVLLTRHDERSQECERATRLERCFWISHVTKFRSIGCKWGYKSPTDLIFYRHPIKGGPRKLNPGGLYLKEILGKVQM